MASSDGREERLAQEIRELKGEITQLRRDVVYGKDALAAVKELRDQAMENVNKIEELAELIRGQMGEMGDTIDGGG